jgi:hypothetical protein
VVHGDYGRDLAIFTSTRRAVLLQEIMDQLNVTPSVPAMTGLRGATGPSSRV